MAIHRFRSCRCHRCSHSGNRFFGYIQSSSSSYSVYGHTRCYRPQHTIRTTAIRRIRFSLCIIHRSIFYRASQPFFCLQALLPGHGTLHTGIVTDDTGNVCLSHCIFSLIKFLQSSNNDNEAIQYLLEIFKNGITTASVLFALAVGATIPIFIFYKRAFTMTRASRRIKK